MSLDLFTGNNAKTNIDIIIPHIKKIITEYLAPHATSSNLDFEKLTVPQKYDECWIVAHCHSLLSYIDFISSEKFDDMKSFTPITRKFITDFKHFNTLLRSMKLTPLYDPYKDEFLTDIFMDREAKSRGAFLFAKNNTDFPYDNLFSPLSDMYRENMTPFLIRHAIELKVKNELLGISSEFRINKNGIKAPANIGINDYIEFLKKVQYEFFSLPANLNVNDIQLANRWANNYTHTGRYEYIWVIKSIITTLEPMFLREFENQNHYLGFNYRSENFSKDDLNTALIEHFKELGGKHKNRNYQFIIL